MGVIVLSILRYSCFFVLLVNASRNVHNQMFSSVIKTPILFFDTNPIGTILNIFINNFISCSYFLLSGRILNRFSKDIGYLDDLLPYMFCDFFMVSIINSSNSIGSFFFPLAAYDTYNSHFVDSSICCSHHHYIGHLVIYCIWSTQMVLLEICKRH